MLCKLGVSTVFAMLVSFPVAAAEFDAFGRPFSEQNMIPAKSNVCATKTALDLRPVLLQGVKPLYPIESVLSRNAGGAVIRYRVGEDGKTTVMSSDTEGPAEARKWFGNHAIIAVGSWTFEPGRRGGVPVPVDCAIKFSFGFD
jgi:hypothetical protein